MVGAERVRTVVGQGEAQMRQQEYELRRNGLATWVEPRVPGPHMFVAAWVRQATGPPWK